MTNNYMIGQRVILNGSEIGTVVAPEHNHAGENDVWVFSPKKGFASYYASHNVKPLPNGQL